MKSLGQFSISWYFVCLARVWHCIESRRGLGKRSCNMCVLVYPKKEKKKARRRVALHFHRHAQFIEVNHNAIDGIKYILRIYIAYRFVYASVASYLQLLMDVRIVCK